MQSSGIRLEFYATVDWKWDTNPYWASDPQGKRHENQTFYFWGLPALLARKKYYLDKYRNDPDIAKRLGKRLHIFETGFDLYTATVAYQSKQFACGFWC